MSIRHLLLASLAALVVLAGAAAAQSGEPCPECDSDGEPDDSWYSSVDTGVITDEGAVLEDTDMSVGENQHGRFTWFQYCLQVLDVFGNHLAIAYEAFVSEDGADVDGSVTVNGETVDLEDTPLGDLDDATWTTTDELPAELPEVPMGHEDLPEGVDVDECLDLAGGVALAC